MLLTVALLAAPAAFAQNGPTIDGNVTLASDYSFRGWSQTQRDPAIQGGFDVAFSSGLYVGTWASNVNFGADDAGNVASMEWDIYVGWTGEVADGVGLDVSYIQFEYPGNRSALNYQELAASLSFSDITLGVNYSPEYLAVGDVTFVYPYADYSYALSDAVTLDLHLGLNMADSPGGDFFGTEQGDEYIDYSAAVSFDLLGASVSLGLYGTDIDDDGSCGRDCELRPILSLSL